MNKKGVIVIQFSWIYTIIVGSLILALFIGVVVRQTKTSETAATGQVQRTLQSILAGASTKAKRFDIIDLPRVDIEYDRFGYRIGELAPFDPGVSFSPSIIKVRGEQLISWTLDWNVPYRIINFLYLTSTQARYIVVGDPILISELEEIFPEEINIEFNPMSVIDKNNYLVKFVFIDTEPTEYQTAINAITKGEASVLKVTPISDDDSYGELTFYDSTLRETGSSYYLGIPSLIAAIFTDDPEPYDVNMAKAYKKLELITDIFLGKMNKLDQHYTDENNLCYGRYDSVVLDTIKAAAQQNQISTISDAIFDLETQNSELRVNSCPMLY
jgi:hypothetical protein